VGGLVGLEWLVGSAACVVLLSPTNHLRELGRRWSRPVDLTVGAGGKILRRIAGPGGCQFHRVLGDPG